MWGVVGFLFCFVLLRFVRICSEPCLPVASLPAWAVCRCLWLVLGNWRSNGWFRCLDFGPVPFFVLAVTFSLSLCQDYPLCWVLPLVSLGRVTLRHLLASWCHARHVPSTGTSHREIWAQGKKQACSCSTRSYRSDHLQVHKTRAYFFCALSLDLSLCM